MTFNKINVYTIYQKLTVIIQKIKKYDPQKIKESNKTTSLKFIPLFSQNIFFPIFHFIKKNSSIIVTRKKIDRGRKS